MEHSSEPQKSIFLNRRSEGADGESTRLLSSDRSVAHDLAGQRSQIAYQSSRDSDISRGSEIQSPLRNVRNDYRSVQSGESLIGEVELPLRTTPSPKSAAVRRGNRIIPPTVNISTKSNVKYLSFIIWSYVIAISVGIFGYVTLRHSLIVSNRNMINLVNRIHDIDASLLSQQNRNNFLLLDLQDQLVEQQITLTILSNLSNAVVLTELANTRSDLYEKMSATQLIILSDMQAIQFNVTEKIDTSSSTVEDLLQQSASTLIGAQANMTATLTDSKEEYDNMLMKAGSVVRAAQLNVSLQLEHNTEQLKNVVDITNKALQMAQRNLTANLARSRQELSDATAETNTALAAAERNVTVKLAKSTSAFKAAVVTATEQLEMVQKNMSISLAVMSGTLRATSADLNAQVETAKVTIHEVS